jgi:RimJ/RimL family protein N-acetyltransferase
MRTGNLAKRRLTIVVASTRIRLMPDIDSRTLRGARVTLRELGEDDAAFMLKLLNDEDFLRNIGDRGVRTLADAQRYINEGPVASYRQHGFGLWAVETTDDRVCLGICGLIRRAGLDDVDIGYAFLPEWRGQGYAFEASELVMNLARECFALRRVVAITSLENPASARLLEKIGLRFERLIRFSEDAEELRLFAWNA